MAIKILMAFLATTVTPQLVEVIWEDGKWGEKNMGEFGWGVVWLGEGRGFWWDLAHQILIPLIWGENEEMKGGLMGSY